MTDQDAYDESVLVSDAWDETVIDQEAGEIQVIGSYRCSCGAVR